MTPNSAEERVALLQDLRIVERGPAIPTTVQAVATRAIEALTRTDNDVSGLVEALEEARRGLSALLGHPTTDNGSLCARVAHEAMQHADAALARARGEGVAK